MRFVQGLIVGAFTVVAGAQDLCIEDSQKLLASDKNAGALFGIHVDIDGTQMVVGASDSGSTVLNGGAVYVYSYIADDWVETNILESTDLDASDFVGYSVGIDADLIIAGAWGDDETASLAGAVYIFERNLGGADNWGQRAKLLAHDGSSNDLFGFDVAIDGDTAVVGAPLDNATELDQGSVYIYQWNSVGETWDYVTRVRAPDPVADAQFGTAVSIDGDTLVVGAIGDNENGSFSGAGYVFERNLGGVDNWGMSKKILAVTADENNQSNDQLGFEVSIDADRIVAGAIRRDLDGVFSGAAYIFERSEGGVENWGQVAELIPSDAQSGQRFGNSVGVSADRIVVGALETNAPDNDAGAAYVYQRDEFGTWQEQLIVNNEDSAADELFGSSVAISGDAFVVGTREDVQDKVVVGSATGYSLGLDCNDCLVDFTGDGNADIFDVLEFVAAYNASDLVADFTGDGNIDIFDVLEFVALYNAGCP